MKIALVQHDVAFEDPAATCDHLAPLVEAAARRGAQLVVLTEMFATGFSMAAERVAEPATGGVGMTVPHGHGGRDRVGGVRVVAGAG